MGSKAYRGKACAYCRTEAASEIGDHVLSRKSFFEKYRSNLPIVPACTDCNTRKSALETYFLSIVLAGSNHAEANRYRSEFVRPRLRRNQAAQRAFNSAKSKWVFQNGRMTEIFEVLIDAERVTGLAEMVAMGLFHHHFERPLGKPFMPLARLYSPSDETEMLRMVRRDFPSTSREVRGDLGEGSFQYHGIQHGGLEDLTVWRMSWHGGISMGGQGAPPAGVSTWVVWTLPEAEVSSLKTTK